MLDSLVITLLLCAGFIGGVLAQWAEQRKLVAQNAALFRAAIHAANERNEALMAVHELRAVNRQLGREMLAAGLAVSLIGCGEPGCANCSDEGEWPEEIGL